MGEIFLRVSERGRGREYPVLGEVRAHQGRKVGAQGAPNLRFAPGTWRAQGCGDGVFVCWGCSAPAGNAGWHCQHPQLPPARCLGRWVRAGANLGMNPLQQLISRAAAISSTGALPSFSSSSAWQLSQRLCPALLPP